MPSRRRTFEIRPAGRSGVRPEPREWTRTLRHAHVGPPHRRSRRLPLDDAEPRRAGFSMPAFSANAFSPFTVSTTMFGRNRRAEAPFRIQPAQTDVARPVISRWTRAVEKCTVGQADVVRMGVYV